MASKLLLLPLVPALAFGMVEVASRISMPSVAHAPISAPAIAPHVVVIERTAPVAPVVIETPPPAPAPEPPCSHGCATSD
jgi:hypothetical protein